MGSTLAILAIKVSTLALIVASDFPSNIELISKLV
jgi:hypothetical protein